ncbi:hypothetical protein D3C78_1459680 [compost metagenome]
MVTGTSLMRRRVDTQRQARQHAEQNGQGGQFQGGREDPGDVGDDRVAGQQGHAEVTVQQVAEVDRELGPQRFVQAQLFVHLGVGRGVGVRANDGQHRVQGHHSSDEKGQQQQPQQRHRHRATAPGRRSGPGGPD